MLPTSHGSDLPRVGFEVPQASRDVFAWMLYSLLLLHLEVSEAALWPFSMPRYFKSRLDGTGNHRPDIRGILHSRNEK